MALRPHEVRQLNRLVEQATVLDEFGIRRRLMSQRRVLQFRPFKTKRREIRDYGAMGLYLIVQPSGHKSWALRFRRPDGRPCKLTLGPVDYSGREAEGAPVLGMPLTVDAARVLATMVHRDRRSGIDVVAQYLRRKRRVRICH
jgi:hypothetical protein